MRRQTPLFVVGLTALLIASQAAFAPSLVQGAVGDPIRYGYDPDGRMTTVIDPNVGSATYTYDATGNTTAISRKAATTVAILEVSPRSGVTGATVSVTGTGFSATAAQNAVTFNGTVASVSSATTTELRVVVPAGATTGTIAVTTPGGAATSATPFVVGSTAPVISGFTPSVVALGDSVTITGSRFEPDNASNATIISAVHAAVTSSSTGSLVAQTPMTGSGHITVDTPNGTAVSAGYLYVAPAPYTAADVYSTGVITDAEPHTVSINVVNKVALRVFEGLPGQRISLDFTAGTMTSDVTVMKPDGSILYPPPGVLFGVGASAFMDLTVLPVAGTYTIFFDPRTNSVGSHTVRLYTVPADATGTITAGGAAVIATNTVPGQNMTRTFTGTLNQRISLDFTAGTITSDVLIKKPDGSTLVTLAIGASAFMDLTVLPVAGTYTIFFDPRTNSVGSHTVRLYTVPADATGTITAGGAAVIATNTVPGQNMTRTFTGTLNQRISLDFTAGTITSDVLIKKPDGSTLVTLAVGASAFMDLTVLPVAGTYTIFFDPRTNSVGSHTVRLYTVPADATGTITAGGAAVIATNTVPGQNMTRTFTGTLNQRISLDFTAGTITSDVLIKKPDGSTLVTLAIGASAFMDLTVLPVAGTYTIFFDPRTNSVGSHTVRLYTVPADATGTITAGGAAVIATNTVPGQNMTRTFTGTLNQRISLDFTAGTITSDVLIKKPDGSTLVTLAVGASAFMDLTVLPVAGTYTIFFDPRTNSVGSHTVRLYTVPADATGTITAGGAAVIATNTVPGQNMTRTFTGTLNQRISLDFTAGTITSDVTLKKPDGTALLGPVGVGATWSSGTVTLPVAGTYTIHVNPRINAVGSHTIKLNNVVGLAPGDNSVHVASLQAATPVVALGVPKSRTQIQTGGVTLAMLRRVDAKETVEPAAPPYTGPEEWHPDPKRLNKKWTTGRAHSASEDQAPLNAPEGVTALSGLVLNLAGDPMKDVTLTIDGRTVTTDATGRFLVTQLDAGREELLIDGRTANRPGKTYGTFEVGVAMKAGQTNVLPYTIWMPKLDTAHAVYVPSVIDEELVITTPHIPGLELHIPAGSTILGEDGEPVTEISITAIPVDRPPFFLPANVEVPIYFTIQPGGAYVEPSGAWLMYPNYQDKDPGTVASFWHYDPEGKDWFIYGNGSVTPDGRQVKPDEGVRIYEFTGAMINWGEIPADIGRIPPWRRGRRSCRSGNRPVCASEGRPG